MIRFWVIVAFSIVILGQTTRSQPSVLSGKFVAYDTLQGLTSPREPKQFFVVEVQSTGLFESGQLLRVIYFAPSGSIRGSARFLGIETLNYSKTWTLSFHKPSTENERIYCADVDGFLRASDGTIDENEKHEPLLRFRSTRFKAYIKFDDLGVMPCLILDSLTPQ